MKHELMVIVALLAGAVFGDGDATSNPWQEMSGESYETTEHWKLDHTPTADEYADFRLSDTAVVTMPTGTYEAPTSLRAGIATEGKMLTLDFSKTTWTDPGFLLSGNCYSIWLDVDSTKRSFLFSSGKTRTGDMLLKLSGATLTISRPTATTGSITFAGGSLNLRDPAGVPNDSGRLELFWGANGMDVVDISFLGTAVDFPASTSFGGSTGVGRLTLDSGEHTAGSVKLDSSEARNVGTNWFVVGPSASLVVQSMILGKGNANWVDVCAETHVESGAISLLNGADNRISLKNGATLDVSDTVTWGGGSNVFEIGGTVCAAKDLLFTSTTAGSELTVCEDGLLKATGHLKIGASGTQSVGLVRIAGGNLDLTSSGGQLYLNSCNNPGSLDFRLESGTVTLKSSGLLLFAGSTATVSGGTLTAPYIYIGFSGTPVVHQTGGSIVADEVVVAHRDAGGGVLKLDGGIVQTDTVRKNLGSGLASLTANGGTLLAKRNGSDIVVGLDSAKVGPKGLTVDVPKSFAVTMSQAIRDADDAAGRGLFVKSGAGKLTVSASASTPSEVVVEEGTLVFANGANTETRLVVTNGATVTLSGNAAATPLKGLAVGDATSYGRIVVSKGETISVEGPVEIVRAEIVFSDDWQIGDGATLLTSTTAVSDASKDAWARALASAGDTEGRSFRFSAEPDEKGGTAFKVVVAAASDYEMRLDEENTVSNATESVSHGLADGLIVSIAKGSTINASGRYVFGSLEKNGSGRLALTGARNVFESVSLNGGTLSVSSMLALGLGETLTINGGILEVSDESATVDFATTVNAGESTAYVVDVDAELSMPMPSVNSGDLVKRGAGVLTYLVTGSSSSLSRDNGVQPNGKTPTPTTQMSFSECGVPVSGYAGLNVMEGTLCVKGRNSDASVSLPHLAYVGVTVPTIAAQPGLVFEDVVVTTPNTSGQSIEIGAGVTEGNSGVVSPSFAMTNATFATIPLFRVGEGSNIALTPRINVDGSLLGAVNYYPNQCMNQNSLARHVFTRGSSLVVGSKVWLYGHSELVFDASDLSGSDGQPVVLEVHEKRSYSFSFLNGARLTYAANAFTTDPTAMSFVFDGAFWNLGSGVKSYPNHSKVSLTSRGEGLILAPAGSDVWTIGQAIACEAPIKIGGTGSVAFADASTDGLVLVGSGRVADSDLANLCIAITDLTGGSGVITFEDCSFAGRVKVDFGRTASDPITVPFTGVPVAKLVGEIPDVSNWRLINTGTDHVRGKFEVSAEGLVTVSSAPPPGIMLIVR